MAENDVNTPALDDEELRREYPWLPKPGRKIPPSKMRELTARAQQYMASATSSLEWFSTFTEVVVATESYVNIENREGEPCSSFSEFLDTYFRQTRERFNKAAQNELVEAMVRAGLSARAIAEQTGTSKSTVNRVQQLVREADSAVPNGTPAARDSVPIQGRRVRGLDGKWHAAERTSGSRNGDGGVVPAGDVGGAELSEAVRRERNKLFWEEQLFQLEREWVGVVLAVQFFPPFREITGCETFEDYVDALPERFRQFQVDFAQRRGNDRARSRRRISEPSSDEHIFPEPEPTKPAGSVPDGQ